MESEFTQTELFNGLHPRSPIFPSGRDRMAGPTNTTARRRESADRRTARSRPVPNQPIIHSLTTVCPKYGLTRMFSMSPSLAQIECQLSRTNGTQERETFQKIGFALSSMQPIRSIQFTA